MKERTALSYKIYPELGFVYAIGSGVVEYRELLAHLEELASDEAYQAPMKKLVDYRMLRLLALNQEELAEFSATKSRFAEKFAGERCAIVSKNNLNYRTTRDHSLQVSDTDLNTRPFKNLTDALNWLEVDLTEADLEILC